METHLGLLSVAGVWAIAAMSPGPNFLISAQSTLLFGRRKGFATVLGIVCGTVVWGLAGFFGLSAVMAAAPGAFLFLAVAGGGYLIYLGLRLVYSSLGASGLGAALREDPPTQVSAWRRGLFTNLANPKTVAFVGSLFVATLPAPAPLWVGLTAVTIMAVTSFTWYSLVVATLAWPQIRDAYGRAQGWIDATAGIVFVVLGMRLAVSDLPDLAAGA
ncbi:LysE family translocator [Pelagibius sp.]|uniref:LysE family translocator n=1 Tax=Pelagibius sp. TaxID=1931238 RepID=UPI003B503182